jgi:hypothetical protein
MYLLLLLAHTVQNLSLKLSSSAGACTAGATLEDGPSAAPSILCGAGGGGGGGGACC